MRKRNELSSNSGAADAADDVSGDPDVPNPQRWKNAFTRTAEWEKIDLLDVLYWFRQIFGIIVGIVWGIIPLTGFIGIVGFCAASSLGFYLYYSKYLGVDEEEFGRWDLFSEGFSASFALFLISWIIVYTYSFGDTL